MGVVIQKGRQERLERPGQPELSRVLELYPEYYKHFLEAQHCLMAGDGALPRQSRHYIAFLAISNSGCDSLISVTIKSFLAAGGDKAWVANTSAAPAKLLRLREMSEMLWKYPWKITNLNVKSLTVGKDSWTLSEIVQAVVIISHHQSLACFVVGTGQDRTQRDRRDRRDGTEERGRKKTQDSALRSDLRIQLNYLSEFSWDEQGFSLMASLYSDMANFIDEKLRFVNIFRRNHPVRCNAGLFRNVRSLQPSNETTKDKQTENICSFVQCLHGIHQDDCTGQGLSGALSPDERIFLENCLFLHSDVDLHQLGARVGYSRKVYLSVLMMEHKQQAQLLFFLAAVMKHLS